MEPIKTVDDMTLAEAKAFNTQLQSVRAQILALHRAEDEKAAQKDEQDRQNSDKK